MYVIKESEISAYPSGFETGTMAIAILFNQSVT